MIIVIKIYFKFLLHFTIIIEIIIIELHFML